MFFYRCTGTISFAPLKSQGVGPRPPYYHHRITTATVPPPCSPKSIYVLANSVRLPSTERFRHGAHESNEVGASISSCECPCGHQTQSVLVQHCRRTFIVDYCQVKHHRDLELRRKHRSDATTQSARTHGLPVRASCVEFQRPKHYRSYEEERRTDFGWIFYTLRWCVEACIEEGV